MRLRVAQRLDLAGEIVNLKLDAVPAAWLRIAPVGHGLARSAGTGLVEQEAQVAHGACMVSRPWWRSTLRRSTLKLVTGSQRGLGARYPATSIPHLSQKPESIPFGGSCLYVVGSKKEQTMFEQDETRQWTGKLSVTERQRRSSS